MPGEGDGVLLRDRYRDEEGLVVLPVVEERRPKERRMESPGSATLKWSRCWLGMPGDDVRVEERMDEKGPGGETWVVGLERPMWIG